MITNIQTPHTNSRALIQLVINMTRQRPHFRAVVVLPQPFRQLVGNFILAEESQLFSSHFTLSSYLWIADINP